MAQHNETGKIGEDLAVKYFIAKGYSIIHRNWTIGKLEIDIIASFENRLHFIEVKTRHTLMYGYPEEGVTKKKVRNLMNAANMYLFIYPIWRQVQIDILSILINQQNEEEYFLIEDVTL